MARGQRHEQQVGLGGDGALGPPEVGHQHRDHQVRQGLRESHQLGGVGELRQEMRRDERADLDLALAGFPGAADPLDLALGRQHRLDALQAVAEADFADHDSRGELLHVLSPNRTGLCREWGAL